jgi:transaldolase
MHPRAEKLRSIGQSLWLDYLDRSLLETGDLARRIREEGLAGVTTNPSIFEKALSSTDLYDAEIERLARRGVPGPEIAEKLMIEDVARAADLFRPLHESTDGVDGYVSLEVRPALAHDTEKTCAEAARLLAAVDRPNVMIKIPSTRAGLEAIRRSIDAGIHVNATLMFSLGHYGGVAKAYLDGLAARVRRGLDVSKISSVASVFVSRIDTAVDAILDARAKRLRGRAAVANAKVVYRAFRETFDGDAFAPLRSRGARMQRVLWGSTGTKDPSYPDTMYVDDLGGRDTVNTVPLQTLDAFLDHGSPRDALSTGLEEARAALAEIASAGVDLDAVCEDLQEKGVRAFAKSYDGLLAAVEKRRGVLLARA